MKKTMTLLVCLVMAMSISARSYEGEVVDTTSQKEFSLNVSEVELRVGETFQLELTWHYPDWVSAYGKFVTYHSGTDVVSVDSNGLITARRIGTTYVYVTGNGVQRKCRVAVVEGAPGVVQHQKGRMTLPLGEFLDDQANDFNVTLTDGTMRLTGSFWGHACIPSELEYEILDGSAFFNIYTSYEDSTCTDGWQGSFMVRQTIDVSFEDCTSDVYNVYVSNVHYEVYEEGTMNAVVYRAAPNRYGTDANVDLDKTAETQALEAVVGEDSIRISGYYYSNCGTGQYCIAEENNGYIYLTFYECGGISANCMENHYVNFTIPRMIDDIQRIMIWDDITGEMQEVKMQSPTSVTSIEQAEADAPYYDLMGRRVTNPTRGIYIRNGKKIVK